MKNSKLLLSTEAVLLKKYLNLQNVQVHPLIIGTESLSWLGELIHGDLAEELVGQGKGFTIWVVE